MFHEQSPEVSPGRVEHIQALKGHCMGALAAL